MAKVEQLPTNNYTSYFSLGNTFKDKAKVSYTDKLSTFVHRFSQQLTANDINKNMLKQHMKRFSLEDKNLKIGPFKKHRKDDDDDEDAEDK